MILDEDEIILIIHYSPDIDARTFKVEPARGGMRSMFNPEPGTSQTVRLPLKEGRTKLKLEVFSITDAPGKKDALRDIDFFEIIRPGKGKPPGRGGSAGR